MSISASELVRFHPVSENLVLAVCERAQRHDTARGAALLSCGISTSPTAITRSGGEGRARLSYPPSAEADVAIVL